MTLSPGQRVKAQMLDSAERALEMTAKDVLKKAQRDVPVETGALRASGRAEVARVGDALEAKVSFNVDYAASQEIGGRWLDKTARGKGSHFVKFHPGGGKPHYLGDSLKTGVRRYRENLKRVIRQDLKAK